jgi:hypothetical protein
MEGPSGARFFFDARSCCDAISFFRRRDGGDSTLALLLRDGKGAARNFRRPPRGRVLEDVYFSTPPAQKTCCILRRVLQYLARREDVYFSTPARRDDMLNTSSCTSVPRPPRRRVLQHPRPPRRHVECFVVHLGTSPAEKSPAKSKGSPGAQRPRRSATAVAERETRKRSPGDDVRRTRIGGVLMNHDTTFPSWR